MANSFETNRQAEPLWLEVRLDQAIFTESVSPELFEHGISQFLICHGRVISSSGRNGDVTRPFEFARLELRTKAESDIVSLKGKLPLGWVEIYENYPTSIILFVRPSLLDSITQHLPIVSIGGISFSLTLPLANHYACGVYPVLEYGYRANFDGNSA